MKQKMVFGAKRAVNRLKISIWDIDWRRNTTLLILAAFIISLPLLLHKIFFDKLPFCLSDNEVLRGICLFISLIFFLSIAQIVFKHKKIKILIVFLGGFLLAIFWDKLIKYTNTGIKNIYNYFMGNISGIINFIIKTNNIETPTLTSDEVKNITQDILVKIIGGLFTFSNILQLVALILLVTLLYLFFRWLSSSSGIIILPFDDSSLELNKKEDNVLGGKAIADLLAAELHRIYHIHNLIEDREIEVIEISSTLLSVCRENLNLCLIKGENISQTLTQAGSIQIADKATLQLGSILITIRQLWPWGTVQIISGSIWKDEKTLKLAARYEQTNYHSNIHAYKIEQEEDACDIPSMLRNLAYQIALDSAFSPLSTSSWKAFKFLTEALSHFYHYIRTKSLTDLNKSFEACKQANKIDNNYKRVADLLSVISFSYLNRDKYDEAEASLTKAMEVNPKSPYVQSCAGTKYYVLGDFEKALKHYQYAKELKPDRYEIYIRIGMVQIAQTYGKTDIKKDDYKNPRDNFELALDLSPSNDAAKSALAWLDFLCYRCEKNEDDLEKAYRKLKNIPEEKKTRMDYSNMAIFMLSKFNKNPKLGTKKIDVNWWKALQIIQYNQRNITEYDKLLTIFFKLLTTNRNEPHQGEKKLETHQVKKELENFMAQENLFLSRRAISSVAIKGLQKDLNILREECQVFLKAPQNSSDHENTTKIENYTTLIDTFLEFLDKKLGEK